MEAHELALSKAKIRLMSRPDTTFFTTVLFSLRIMFDDRVPTACTNGKWIKIGTKFFMELNPEEQLFLLVHEALHVAYMHMMRLSGRDMRKWNWACDYVINLHLVERGFKIPSVGLLDHKYKGMRAEQIYDLLPNDPPPELMEDLVESDEDHEAIERDIQDILIRASMQAKMAGDKPGTIPGEIEIFLQKLLNPKLPWDKLMRKWLQKFAKTDYSWRKPNRRFFPKFHLPSLHGVKMINAAIAVDTSGSVTDEEFHRAVSETYGMINLLRPEKVTFIQFDTNIKSVDEIKTAGDMMNIKFTGRGGTLIEPVLEWANAEKPELLLVFSDGGFSFYDVETRVPVLWLIYNNGRFNAPFGKVVHYEV